MEEGAPFCPPPKRIGDILASLSPEEVCAIVLGTGDRVTSPAGAFAALRRALSEFPIGRLEEIAFRHGNDREKLGRDELLAFICDDDAGLAASECRARQRWSARAATRSELLKELTDREANAAAVRCEVAFGLHIRPMLAITRDMHNGDALFLPWRCWFDLEAAIDSWSADKVARRTSLFEHYPPATERGRDFLAAGSCVALARTVAGILEERHRVRSIELPFRFEVATSMESIGLAAHLLERRHRQSVEREATRLRSHLGRYQSSCENVLLDAVLLLQPGLPETAVVWEPPPPRPISDDDDDLFF